MLKNKKRGRESLEVEDATDNSKRQAISENTYKTTSNSNSQPLGTPTAVLSLLEQKFIESITCKKKNRLAVKLYQENQLNEILVKTIEQEQETIEITGLVCETQRIIFHLQTNKNKVPAELKLKNGKCNCNSFQEKDLCEHIISVLYYIYKNGSSSVEEFDSLSKLLENQSQENLVGCLKYLIGKRPEILSLVKEQLISKNQSNLSQRVFSAAWNPVIVQKSPDSRKSRLLPLTRFTNLQFDPEKVIEEIKNGFDSFIRSYSPSCREKVYCTCTCHHRRHSDQMSDGSAACDCNGSNGDYSFISKLLTKFVDQVNHFVQSKFLVDSLICMEAVLRAFATELNIIQLENETSTKKIVINFPFDYSREAYQVHVEQFRFAASILCQKFAELVVLKDIDSELKFNVAEMIKNWESDAAIEVKPFLPQLIFACLDLSSGQNDSITNCPLVVLARKNEFKRAGDTDALLSYCSKLGISPSHTPSFLSQQPVVPL